MNTDLVSDCHFKAIYQVYVYSIEKLCILWDLNSLLPVLPLSGTPFWYSSGMYNCRHMRLYSSAI